MNRRKLEAGVGLLCVILSGSGCSPRLAPSEAESEVRYQKAIESAPAEAPGAPAAESDAAPQRARAKRAGGFGMAADGLGGGAAAASAPAKLAMAMEEKASEDEGGAVEEPARTRSYFPETFLFEPIVVTDAAGAARLEVRVPDRLTTWRILALAHARDGSQAGTEASFVGTLPAYIDPVVPPALFVGDEVRIPIQVVNTTDAPITRTLVVEATGAARAKGGGPVRVEASSSEVESFTLRADRPGVINLRASLEGKDAVEHVIPVAPTGKPWVERRGGTLARPRELELQLPKGLDVSGTTARLLVYPGALALLRSELGAVSARGGAAEDAYTLLLAGRAAGLLERLGGEADPKALRKLGIVAGQRALRAARSPDPLTASLFLEPALAHPDNPVLARLAARLGDGLAREQRPDGTFLGGSGWTLQRLLVATSACVQALQAKTSEPRAPLRAQRALLLASGAVERNVERIEDGYTAAAILVSGAASGSVADRLRARVREKVSEAPDGTRFLSVEPGVVRADGAPPTIVEATALAVLALKGDAAGSDVVPDLGAYILGAYDPRTGFGDGRTNLSALGAVLALFDAPLPPKVEVMFELDGRPVAAGVLEATKIKDVLVLEAPLNVPAGAHTFRVQARPDVPGLGYALVVKTFLPWEAEPNTSGLELEVTPPKTIRVGAAGVLHVAASAPSGGNLEVEVSLPAGLQMDRAELEGLRSRGILMSFELTESRLTLAVPARSPGQAFQVDLRAIPTLSGTLRSGPSAVRLGASEQLAPPVVWNVSAL